MGQTLDGHAPVQRRSLNAKIKHRGGKAAYNRARDLLKLPYPTTFMDAHSYYTSLHEHGHWTGTRAA